MANENEESQWQRITVNFYSYMNDSESFINYITDSMNGVLEGDVQKKSDSEFELTLMDGSPIFVHITADADEMKKQTNGMAGFFMQAPVKNEEVKRAAIIQIQNFRYIASVTLFLDEQKNRTNDLYGRLFKTAGKAGAFILTGDMRLMDENCRTLIAKDGSTDFEEYFPKADKGAFPQVEEDQCDKDRRERSLEVLRKLGLPFIEKKAPAIAEKKCDMISKEDLIHRLACVFTASACADACTYSPDSAAEDVENFRNMFEEKFNISKYVSAYEGRYISDPLNHAKYHNTHIWRYECCSIMMWALGLVDIDLPTDCCDPAEICKLMFNTDFDDLCAKANMRSKEEILDRLDLVYRLNWACVDAQIKHQQVEVVNPSVVYFWHYALNWMAGVDGNRNWDAIQPNT